MDCHSVEADVGSTETFRVQALACLRTINANDELRTHKRFEDYYVSQESCLHAGSICSIFRTSSVDEQAGC